jgi:integrase
MYQTLDAQMGAIREMMEQMGCSANLDNSTNNNDETESDANTNMSRIQRTFLINGKKVPITANNEQEIAEKFAVLKYPFQGEGQSVCKHNMADFVKENWRFIEQTVAPQTAREYRRYLNNNILPFFGKMDIEDIDWRDVQLFYDGLASNARQTVHKRKIVLSRLLQIAVGDKVISVDPTKNKKLVYSRIVHERAVPDLEEYRQIAAAIPSLSQSHYRLYMALIAFTGMRRGEALALRWENILFDKNEIFIDQSVRLDKNDNGEAELKAPKTKAGVRKVPMIEALKNILLPHRKDQGFVVTDARTDKPVHTDATFNTMWRYIKKELGIEEFSSHSFRHAVATLYIANGVDIKTTQTILGHSQASTTMNIYAHAVPRNIENAAKLFNEIILPNT